ncbi:MAG: RidA family protein [Chitinophagaceae bacterium]|nr:RidA family protein [Chitinophagaceae bacterium]
MRNKEVGGVDFNSYILLTIFPDNSYKRIKNHNMYNYLITILLLFSSALFGQKTAIEKLDSMGLKLPPTSTPMANYVKFVRTGNLVYTSGHGPTTVEGKLITGKLGADLNIEQGYEAAKVTGLQLLATLQQAIGDLGKVKRVVKVLGMVHCTDDFKDQPKVMNGFSDLMVAVFGEKGRHARSAVGMNALPNGMAVEIEMIVEVE